MANPINPAGASNIHPNMATSRAESEVTNTPSAQVPSGAGQAQGSSQSTSPGPQSSGLTVASGDPAALAMLAVIAVIAGSEQSLAAWLDPPVAGSTVHPAQTLTNVLAAMDAVVQLLRVRPVLAVNVDPTELAANADRIRAGQALASTLRVLLTNVEGTNTVNLTAGWSDVRSVYRTAKPEAPGDATTAEAIVPIAALFVRSKRTVAAVTKAAADSLKSVEAASRATASETRATASRQRASALVPQLTITGTGDATITQPAPSAPAPSTTAPSALASGATPGTPGSTTIR